MTLRGGDVFAVPLARRSGTAEKLLYLLLVLFLFSVTRIALAQICLTLISILWLRLVLARRGSRAFRSLPLMVPLFFFFLQNLVSASLSLNPWLSLNQMLGMFNLLVLLLFYNILEGEGDVLPLVHALVLMGGMAALIGLGQYVIDDVGGIQHRISGPLSHYMTYSGILMLIDVLIIALLASMPAGKRGEGRGHWWVWACLVLVTLALVLTYSRHAWLGLLAGIAVIAVCLRSWKLITVPLALVAALALTQGTLAARILNIFDTRNDVSNVDRLNQLKSGLRMIVDNPLQGVGPGMVEELYPAYRTTSAVKDQTSHLHNTPMQICAETGLVGLGIWLWFVLRLFSDLVGRLRGMGGFAVRPHPAGKRPDPRLFFQLGPLAAATAFFTAGIFEYNFGDTEVLILFIFIISTAYSAWDRHAEMEPNGGLEQ
jgi:O-antigen ligase